MLANKCCPRSVLGSVSAVEALHLWRMLHPHPLPYQGPTGGVQLGFACTMLPTACQAWLICALAVQARIVGLNAQYFLKNGGFYVISIKASCIDSTAQPEAVFAREVKKLSEMLLKPKEQVTLEPYERDHAMVVGVYRPPPKAKAAA